MKKVLYDTIQDNSYTTVRHGRVPSYSGVQLIRDGGQWIAGRGLGPLGGPDRITEIGSIKRIFSDADPQFWSKVARWLWLDGAAPASALQARGEKARRLVESILAKLAHRRKA